MKVKVTIETSITGKTCKGCYFLDGDYSFCDHPDFQVSLAFSTDEFYEKRCEACLERYKDENQEDS